MPLRNKHAAAAHGINLLLTFAKDLIIGSSISFFPAISQVHPKGIAKMACRLSRAVDNLQLLKELPHAIVDAVAELLAQTDMVLKAGREIAEHRVDLCGKRHQVGRISGQNAIEAPIQIVE